MVRLCSVRPGLCLEHAGSRYRFLRGLDCLLAGLASLFLYLVGAGEEGRVSF